MGLTRGQLVFLSAFAFCHLVCAAPAYADPPLPSRKLTAQELREFLLDQDAKMTGAQLFFQELENSELRAYYNGIIASDPVLSQAAEAGNRERQLYIQKTESSFTPRTAPWFLSPLAHLRSLIDRFEFSHLPGELPLRPHEAKQRARSEIGIPESFQEEELRAEFPEYYQALAKRTFWNEEFGKKNSKVRTKVPYDVLKKRLLYEIHKAREANFKNAFLEFSRFQGRSWITATVDPPASSPQKKPTRIRFDAKALVEGSIEFGEVEQRSSELGPTVQSMDVHSSLSTIVLALSKSLLYLPLDLLGPNTSENVNDVWGHYKIRNNFVYPKFYQSLILKAGDAQFNLENLGTLYRLLSDRIYNVLANPLYLKKIPEMKETAEWIYEAAHRDQSLQELERMISYGSSSDQLKKALLPIAQQWEVENHDKNSSEFSISREVVSAPERGKPIDAISGVYWNGLTQEPVKWQLRDQSSSAQKFPSYQDPPIDTVTVKAKARGRAWVVRHFVPVFLSVGIVGSLTGLSAFKEGAKYWYANHPRSVNLQSDDSAGVADDDIHNKDVRADAIRLFEVKIIKKDNYDPNYFNLPLPEEARHRPFFPIQLSQDPQPRDIDLMLRAKGPLRAYDVADRKVLSFPIPEKHRISSVSVTDLEGTRLKPGRDFELKGTLDGTLAVIELNSSVIQKKPSGNAPLFHVEMGFSENSASYYYDVSGFLKSLLIYDGKRLERLKKAIALLKDAGFKKLSEELESKIQHERPLRIQELAYAFEFSGNYKIVPTGRKPIPTPNQNPFLEYRRFLDSKACFTGHCQPSEWFFADFLRQVYLPSEAIIEDRVCFLRPANSKFIRTKDYHVRAQIRNPNSSTETFFADATPWKNSSSPQEQSSADFEKEAVPDLDSIGFAPEIDRALSRVKKEPRIESQKEEDSQQWRDEVEPLWFLPDSIQQIASQQKPEVIKNSQSVEPPPKPESEIPSPSGPSSPQVRELERLRQELLKNRSLQKVPKGALQQLPSARAIRLATLLIDYGRHKISEEAATLKILELYPSAIEFVVTELEKKDNPDLTDLIEQLVKVEHAWVSQIERNLREGKSELFRPAVNAEIQVPTFELMDYMATQRWNPQSQLQSVRKAPSSNNCILKILRKK